MSLSPCGIGSAVFFAFVGIFSMVIILDILYFAYKMPTPTPDTQLSKEATIKVLWILLISQIVVNGLLYLFQYYICDKEYVKLAWSIFVIFILINVSSIVFSIKTL